ncbi:hypothetical protein AMTRI_Chr13g124620 [Amborella trichopoda]
MFLIDDTHKLDLQAQHAISDAHASQSLRKNLTHIIVVNIFLGQLQMEEICLQLYQPTSLSIPRPPRKRDAFAWAVKTTRRYNGFTSLGKHLLFLSSRETVQEVLALVHEVRPQQ